MGKICENPLDCEIGDVFPDDGRALLWGCDITEDLFASTLYEPSADNIDPSVLDFVFMQITAEIEGEPVNVALRIDPDNWTRDYPYGWKVIEVLAEGQ